MSDQATTPLEAWFQKTKRQKSEVARKVGCAVSRISQICAGETPSLRLALAIENETDGEVTCAALLQDAPSKLEAGA